MKAIQKTIILLCAVLFTALTATAQTAGNKAIITTDKGSQELNTNEISVIRFDGGKVTFVQPWGETTFNRTLRQLTFFRPLPGMLRLTVNAQIDADDSGAKGSPRRVLGIDGEGRLESTWNTSDQVYVFSDAELTTNIGILEPETPGSNTSRLVGDINAEGLADGATLYLATKESFSYTAQSGSLDDLFYATASATLSINGANATMADATFTRPMAITRFTLTDGTNPLVASSITISGGAEDITVTPEPETDVVYVAMPQTDVQTTYTFTATVSGEVCQFTGTKKANVQADKYYRTSVTLTKVKIDPVVTAPTAASLAYTGSALPLVDAGSTTGGELQYKLDNGTYSTDIPTATNAGSYTVYYKVVGDDDYNDVEEQSVGVTINKVAATLTCNNSAISFSASEDKTSTKTKTGVSCVGGTISVASANTGNFTVSYSNGTITITRKTNSAFSNIKATVSVTPDANHTATSVTFNVSATEAYTDLSKIDCAGNDRSSMWTANCYMVQKAGKYKLPLVYGNAIKNGAANTAAYTGVSGTNTTATFPNHAGTAINAPWITKPTSGSGVNKGMGYTAKTAELLWQDAKGLITAVGIDGYYLTLTVGKNASAQEGNALIAVKDANGTILWSWHIWVTKQTFATANLTTINTGSHTYKVTPVNIGWIGNAKSKGVNTYFQWGRKDPFIPTKNESVQNRPVYNISNSDVTGLTYKEDNSQNPVTIADNIKNPTTLYHCSYYKYQAPSRSMFYNMWDAKQTGGGDNVSTATKKTVYDPCPPGFCVPTSNLYKKITSGRDSYSEFDNTYYGLNVSSIANPALFFPASGCRGQSTTGYRINTDGFYWSASVSTEVVSAYHFTFSSYLPSMALRIRSSACSIRAVVEE